MKKDMPLEGLRWSRDSGSALCDTSQNSRSRTGWGGYKTSVHKFPLDFSFLVYCTSAIVVLSALFSYIKIGYNSLLNDWNKNGYSIYLYQCFTAFFFYSVSYSCLLYTSDAADEL